MNFISPNKTPGSEQSVTEEEELWQSFKDGDLRAYEQIFKLFYKDLYGYGLNLCSRPELVRDCIQTLFVILWERKTHLNLVRSIKAYLLASLRRQILKTLRQEKTRNGALVNHTQQSMDPFIQFSSEERWIEEEVKKSQKHALQEALGYLPERQKEILFLKYYNGMSYEEMEEILSINYQSIRNHIYRALQKLRAHLKEKEDFSDILVSLLLLLLPVLWCVW